MSEAVHVKPQGTAPAHPGAAAAGNARVLGVGEGSPPHPGPPAAAMDWRFLRRLKTATVVAAIPLLGAYLKEMKSLCRREIVTPTFTAAFLTTAKTWTA